MTNPRYEAVCTHPYASHGWYILDRLTGRTKSQLTRKEAAEQVELLNKSKDEA